MNIFFDIEIENKIRLSRACAAGLHHRQHNVILCVTLYYIS